MTDAKRHAGCRIGVMRDELFTMMGEMPTMSPELLARMREEANRNLLRMKHWSEMVMNPKEPEVGPTPAASYLPHQQVAPLAVRVEAHRAHPAAICAQSRDQPALHLRPPAQGL